MGQASHKNQGILWHYSKCRQNSNIDCYIALLNSGVIARSGATKQSLEFIEIATPSARNDM
jgi:hypothetical protein